MNLKKFLGRQNLSKFSLWILFLSLFIYVPINLATSTTTCTVSTSTIEGVRVDSITSLAECTYDVPSDFNNVSLVVVGGGGSGGSDAGAGGGGGGVQIRTNVPLNAGTVLTIDVGAGGASTSGSNQFGNNGERTIVTWAGDSITAEAGQAGQPCTFNTTNFYCTTNTGGDAGLGGGAGGTGPFHGYPNRTASGGGANSTATLAFTRAETGTPFQIGNTRMFFGGGGGGAVQGYGPGGNPVTINGGIGGGGNGETATAATDGAPNSGGGGGGASVTSGKGAAGIVLVVLQNLGAASTVTTSCTQGSFTRVQFGREVILTYYAGTSQNGSCSLTVPTDVYSAHYLVVAGGGGGASGGGGAGGAISSWRTISDSGAQIQDNSSPMALSPGSTINITVGKGGASGNGGNLSCWGTCTGLSQRVGVNGSDSSLGSVTASGGGRGGKGNAGGGGSLSSDQTASSGGSGGGAGFDVATTTAAAASSNVVGASTYGTSGGTVSTSGGYRAGSGGGGGASSGGAPRQIFFRGDSAATPTSTSAAQDTLGGGGNGGSGIFSNIGSFARIYSAYSCGGGGGINSNLGRADNGAPYTDITTVWRAGGKAGCYTGGKGSNRSTRRSNQGFNSTTASSDFNGTSGVNGFGGGGGGTDPEDMAAGRGGDGIVIVRFTLPDSRCPNDHNEVVTPPLACIAKIRITAGDTAASTESSRTTDVAASPISYSNESTTVSVVTGVSGLTTSIVNNKIVASVTSRTSSLIGGTYPVTYRLTNGSSTSDGYLLVTVRDPEQRTQLRVPVDPRDQTVRLPKIVIGSIQAVQVCVSPRTDSNYPIAPSAALASNPGNTSADSPSGNNLRMQGTADSITANIGFINLTTTQSRLIRNGFPITLDINVSNTSTGGNGACDFGTDSTMTLFPLRLTHTRTFAIQPKNGRQR